MIKSIGRLMNRVDNRGTEDEDEKESNSFSGSVIRSIIDTMEAMVIELPIYQKLSY